MNVNHLEKGNTFPLSGQGLSRLPEVEGLQKAIACVGLSAAVNGTKTAELDMEGEEEFYWEDMLFAEDESSEVDEKSKQQVQSIRVLLEERHGQSLKNRIVSRIRRGDFDEELKHGRRGDVSVAPETMKVADMFFTRVSRYEVQVDVFYSVKVRLTIGSLQTEADKEFCCSVILSMYEDEATTISYGEVALCDRLHRMTRGVALDEFLIPYYSREDMERVTLKIYTETAPEMLQSPKSVNAEKLAERLGLTIIYLPLYKRRKTASMLFFCKGTVVAQDQDGKPYTVEVQAKTIVLNMYYEKNEAARKLAIFHECLHYMEHYLFFRGQRMCCNDTRVFAKRKGEEITRVWRAKKKTRTDKGKDDTTLHTVANPLRTIEWQAKQGSFCLMFPKPLLMPLMNDSFDRLKGSLWHAGKKLESVCRTMASAFDAPKYCAKCRAIGLGYIEAKGALNYVDGHYITPFAFARDAGRGSYTFVISAKEVIREYVENENFRRLVDLGHYVYVDGHMCVDDDKFVSRTADGPALTLYANAHVDECCLRFKVVYEEDEDPSYCYGQLCSDDEYNQRYLTYDSITETMSLRERVEFYDEIIRSLPKPAHQAISAHMKRLGVKTERMAERCDVNESSIKRILNGTKKTFTLDQILIICFGLHLPPELSDDLIKRSNNRLLDRAEGESAEARNEYYLHMIYRILLRSFYLMPLREIQRKLMEERQLMLDYQRRYYEYGA